jgi:hypothetical protein
MGAGPTCAIIRPLPYRSTTKVKLMLRAGKLRADSRTTIDLLRGLSQWVRKSEQAQVHKEFSTPDSAASPA